MATQKYNTTWTVSFLPNRIEVIVNDRDTNATLFDNYRTPMAVIELDKSIESVEAFLANMGVKVFNYEVHEHARQNTLNFVGKGLKL